MYSVIDRKTATDRMQKVLDQTGLGNQVDAEHISNWLDIDEGMGLGIDVSVKILSGLFLQEVFDNKETIDNLMYALMELYNSINAREPPPEMKRETMRVEISEMKLPPDGWTIHYSRAMGLMNDSKFLESSDEFNKVFEMLLEEPTTRGDLFRIYYNASIAHHLGGRPDLGELCLKFSLRLNPNYPLARKKMEEMEKGEADDLIKLGIMNRLQRSFEEDRERMDLKRYAGRSEKDLIRELEGYGVTFSREELVKASRESESRDEVVGSLFLDWVDKDSPDADNVWAIAHTLWDRHCSEEPVAEAIIDRCAEIEEILKEDDDPTFKMIDKYLADIENVVYSRKKGVIERWSKFQEYASSDRHTLMDLFTLLPHPKDNRERFISLSDHLFSVLGDPFWRITPIILKEWDTENRVDEMRRKYPEFYLLHVYLHLHYLKENDLARAHEAILETIEIVEANRKNKKNYEWNSGSNLSDMDHVYTLLEEFYENFELEGKQTDILKKGKKATARLRKRDDGKLDEKLNEMMRDGLKQNHTFRYMEFVEKLGIDYHTEEDADATIRNIDPLGRRIRKKKIGRNEPCPCGSGKKYKNCCLKI